MSQLYVGNLSSEANEQHVRDIFSQFGTVKEVILKSGFSFVEMGEHSEALACIRDLNGKMLMGSVVIVELSRQQRLSCQRPKQFKLHLGKVHFSNIPDTLQWQKLVRMVTTFGKVLNTEILETGESSLPRSALFYMETLDEAQKVVTFFRESPVDKNMAVTFGTENTTPLPSPVLPHNSIIQDKMPSTPSSPTKSSIQSNTEYPLRILVPSDMVGAIIGKDGNTIRQITQIAKARVDVHRKETIRGLEKAITIIGTPDACTEAAFQVGLIIQKEIIASSNLDNEMFGDVPLPTIPLKILAHNELVGRVIGKNGQTLKKIMNETETKIIISKIKDPNDQNQERTITVLGSLLNCKRAESMISAKLRASYESDMAHFNSNYQGLSDMPSLYCPKLYNYSDNNGADVTSPTNIHSLTQPFSSTSLPTSPICDQHYSTVFDNNHYETMITVPKDALCSILGHNSFNLTYIAQISSAIVKVVVSDASEHADQFISIIGNMESQAKAQKCIFTKTSQEGYGHGTDTVLTVDMFVPSLLINRVNTQIRQLQHHTGALIEIPRDLSDHRAILPLRILGNYQSSQAAQKKILSLLMIAKKSLQIQQHHKLLTSPPPHSDNNNLHQSHSTLHSSHGLSNGFLTDDSLISNCIDLPSQKEDSSPPTRVNGLSNYTNLHYEISNSRLKSTSSDFSSPPQSLFSSRRSSASIELSTESIPDLHLNNASKLFFDGLSNAELYQSPRFNIMNGSNGSYSYDKDGLKLNLNNIGTTHSTSEVDSHSTFSDLFSSEPQKTVQTSSLNRIKSSPHLSSLQNSAQLFNHHPQTPTINTKVQRAAFSQSEINHNMHNGFFGTNGGFRDFIFFNEDNVSQNRKEHENPFSTRHLEPPDYNDVFQEPPLYSKFVFAEIEADLIHNLTRLTTTDSPEPFVK